MFFDLHARGLLDHREATLSDSNPDLVACYCAVRDFTEQVLGELSRLARDHARRGAAHYYDVRDNRFNPQRAALFAQNGHGVVYSPALAAMFIYLNRTGYNGLFRLNADGQFNVPCGRYANPRISDEARLHRAASALAFTGVNLMLSSFDSVVAGARPGDFLYFDPPYAPVSRTARFTQYTASGFDLDEQTRLRDIAVSLAQRGCHVIVSNSTAPDITLLYSTDIARAAGLHCHTVPARRAINSNPKRRGVVSEYVITNIRD
jgi:DNA adenine methylase